MSSLPVLFFSTKPVTPVYSKFGSINLYNLPQTHIYQINTYIDLSNSSVSNLHLWSSPIYFYQITSEIVFPPNLSASNLFWTYLPSWSLSPNLFLSNVPQFYLCPSIKHACRNLFLSNLFLPSLPPSNSCSLSTFDNQPRFMWHRTDTTCWLGLVANFCPHRSPWSLCGRRRGRVCHCHFARQALRFVSLSCISSSLPILYLLHLSTLCRLNFNTNLFAHNFAFIFTVFFCIKLTFIKWPGPTKRIFTKLFSTDFLQTFFIIFILMFTKYLHDTFLRQPYLC